MKAKAFLVGLGAAVAISLAQAASVEVNTATVNQLDQVSGIGKRLAKRIVAERSKNGEFADWPDLVKRVSGVGATNAAKLSDKGLLVKGSTFTTAGGEGSKTAGPASGQATGVQSNGRLAEGKDGGTTPMSPPGIGTQAPATPSRAATQ